MASSISKQLKVESLQYIRYKERIRLEQEHKVCSKVGRESQTKMGVGCEVQKRQQSHGARAFETSISANQTQGKIDVERRSGCRKADCLFFFVGEDAEARC
jgi:hypothetical protein